MTLCSDSKPSSIVLNPLESRVTTNQSFCVLEKTPILLQILSISPKPWSNSSIPSVDVFTSPLWSCLRNLVIFGLDLVTRSSSFRKNAGWKAFLESVSSSTGWTDALKLYASDQPVYRSFSELGFSGVLLLHRCFSYHEHRFNRCIVTSCPHVQEFTRLTGVLSFHNTGLAGAQDVSSWCSSGQLHQCLIVPTSV